MNDPRGSCWRKWDLHVHTPASLTNPYRSSGGDPWEAFFRDLEALPPEFSVIGINDYIFIDGYRKVLQARQAGRLKNIDLFLPVIELRLDRFGGTKGDLSKVNFHVIFSEELDPDVIQTQFLNALGNRYELTPQYSQLKRSWKGLVTLESLEHLGRLIIESVPADKQHQYGSALSEGFNNLTLTSNGIHEALDSSYLRRKYLIAVGKTEWADIKWSDQSIADKKNLINDADLVFIAAQSPAHWKKAHDELVLSKVNSHLLDCSDAHHFSTSKEKDRIGNCFTWIKADPTFEGLRQTAIEYAQRVYVGDRPDKLRLVEANPTKYIKSLSITKLEGSPLNERWFDSSLELSTDLVAIIGNKGSGKSALLDIIALLGNTRQGGYFAFLNPKQFRQPLDSKARHFRATCTWHNGQTATRELGDDVPGEAVEVVKYLPQNFLEAICNETAGSSETRFDQELKNVIFSHVSSVDRLGHVGLDALLSYRTSEISGRIDLLKKDLRSVNETIVDLEGQVAPEYRTSTLNLLTNKQGELAALDAGRPVPLPRPEDAPVQIEAVKATSDALEVLLARRDQLAIDIAEASSRQADLAKRLALIARLIHRSDNIKLQFETFRRDFASDLHSLNLTFEALFTFEVRLSVLENQRDSAQHDKATLDLLLDSNRESGLLADQKACLNDIAALEAKLDEPQRQYQENLLAIRTWEERRAVILGANDVPGTIRYYEGLLAAIDLAPNKLAALVEDRMRKACEIHDQISTLADVYRDLYKPVQHFIETHAIAKDKLQLRFEVTIVE